MSLPKFPGACVFAEISGRRVPVFFCFLRDLLFFSPNPAKPNPAKRSRARKKKKKKNESHG